MSSFSREKLPLAPLSNDAGAPQFGILPSRQVPSSMSQHRMAHESARMDIEARAHKPRVSHPSKRLSPTLHTSAPQFLPPNHMSQILINGPISARTNLSELDFPIPSHLLNKQYYKTGKTSPHAPDSSARISDCRKACDKPADVKFTWPYHDPCIDIEEMIGRADWMS